MPDNGFPKIRSWSDVGAIAMLVAMLAGAFTWLLKLDFAATNHGERISALEGQAEKQE